MQLPKKKDNIDTSFDGELARLTELLADLDPTTDEYRLTVNRIRDLKSFKNPTNEAQPHKEFKIDLTTVVAALITAGASLAAVWKITKYEDEEDGIVTTKSINFIPKR